MSPDFGTFLVTGIAFSLVVLGFIAWRFGWLRAAAFAILAGLFPASMDFLSSFAAGNYEYPGQTRLWVFTYIFFGWISVCGICLLLAEGILARFDEDLLSVRRMRWQAPFLAAVIAVALDLFIDPIAVRVGYWVWLVPANVYDGIPLLNFVGWFVLMLLAPYAWIEISRREGWSPARVIVASVLALPLLAIASVMMSLALNGAIAAAGLQ